jgi:hypothetical protein
MGVSMVAAHFIVLTLGGGGIGFYVLRGIILLVVGVIVLIVNALNKSQDKSPEANPP